MDIFLDPSQQHAVPAPVAHMFIALHIYIIYICFVYGVRLPRNLLRFHLLTLKTCDTPLKCLWFRSSRVTEGSRILKCVVVCVVFKLPLYCPSLHPGLTLSGALWTTAYWKFLRTDPRQGSCYEWVVLLCNPFSCDLTSCTGLSLSHADESFPPTHFPLIPHHLPSILFKTGAERTVENCWFSLLSFVELCFLLVEQMVQWGSTELLTHNGGELSNIINK